MSYKNTKRKEKDVPRLIFVIIAQHIHTWGASRASLPLLTRRGGWVSVLARHTVCSGGCLSSRSGGSGGRTRSQIVINHK